MVTFPRQSKIPHSSLLENSSNNSGMIFSKEWWLLCMTSSNEGIRSSGKPHCGDCFRILFNSFRLFARRILLIGCDVSAIFRFCGSCVFSGFSNHVIMARSLISIKEGRLEDSSYPQFGGLCTPLNVPISSRCLVQQDKLIYVFGGIQLKRIKIVIPR